MAANMNHAGDELPPPPGTGSPVLIIGIAGGSGCGKSVFCTKLEKMMHSYCTLIVLSYDNYYKDKEQVDAECAGNWDCPEALNTKELVQHLNELKQGKSIVVPFYDFAKNRRIPEKSQEVRFPQGSMGVLLVEGLMVLYDDDLRNMIDVRIFIDCDEDTRFMRRLARDTDPVRGRGRTVGDVYSAWSRCVKPNHHRFVEPTKRFAHVIIPYHGLFADPGHLLAVSEDPSTLLAQYERHKAQLVSSRRASLAAADAAASIQDQAAAAAAAADGGSTGLLNTSKGPEMEGDIWPALYMIQSLVRRYLDQPTPTPHTLAEPAE